MHIRINWSLNVSEVFHFFLVNTVVMLCFLNKSSLVKNFDLSSVLPVDPVKYIMTNITFFFGWKLHLLPGMKPVSSSSPEIYLAIMWMQKHGLYASGKREWAFSLAFSLACGECHDIVLSEHQNQSCWHANFMPGMPSMPNPNGFTISMPGMPNRTSKNWEWIISPARDLRPKFS